MQIYLHFLGIFAGVSVAFFLGKIRKPWIKMVFALIIVSLAVPTAVGNLFDFYGRGAKPNSKVSNQELVALDWLKKNSNPKDIILTKPFKGEAEYRYKTKPWPISAWYSTPYVYVFSNRYAYISGEEQLMITGYNPETELKLIRKFFDQNDFEYNKNLLKEKNISFIYVRKDEIKSPFSEESNKIKQVFANDEVLIYKVEL
jgi:uncharacterized membrane protein